MAFLYPSGMTDVATPPPAPPPAPALDAPLSIAPAYPGGLAEFVARHPRLFVLSGAGCSTGSGIPDYRDAEGQWKRAQPVTLQAFLGSEATRRRYWARGMVGWRFFRQVRPNRAHAALARLEERGRCELLLTQNVDRLHQAAGSRRVIDLHGRLDVVRCLGCGHEMPREAMQEELVRRNPDWAGLGAGIAPDGDADLEGRDFGRFVVPDCPVCGGLLKPDVVFFGENVPRERVEEAYRALERADAMLVVGSSLMVYSGFRFVQAAAKAGKPLAAVNLGRTRADGMLALKVEQSCEEALAFLL
ncbi:MULTISPECIES: NAD-dependent protein deacetylase [Roseomonas]|uniref:NAD-dependent protein deacetylase n=1 Tax=Roseomonas TaxID=125216 RepID=UPI001D015DED|nr:MULTISPECIES: NAD-dependent protein deacetylase [Roseomonas]USQ73007.1 NAD-dependent protein deacetylase [Roseomonas mucosa]